jgi:uncharacterized membrane protein YhiD involved in acid resistance
MSGDKDKFDRKDFDLPQSDGPAPARRGQPYNAVRLSAQDAVKRAASRGKPEKKESSLAQRPGLLVGIFIGGVALLAIVVYMLVSQSTRPAPQPQPGAQAPPTQQPPANTQTQPTPAPQTDKESESPITGIFGTPSGAPEHPPDESWLTTGARITLKLALAALLAAMLAFRPRKDLPVLQRNPYVGQTQILLAVVAAALMMVVADNAARAFGIFAAASLVRFRTNIRDPKEITVLLVSLAIGLASGVGRVEVAIILSVFVLIMLWVLEYYEPAQVFRAMELTVVTRRVDETDEVLREIFEKRSITSEIRKVDREDEEDPVGKIVYYVNVGQSTSTDQLSEEIFAADPDNIDSIQWDQKKSTSYIFR